MTNAALAAKRTKQTARTGRVPSPTGGWDAKNSLEEMPPDRASILDNWIPRAGRCRMRRGFAPQVTGTPAAVETVIAWNAPVKGSDQLFAFAGGSIFNTTTQGAPIGSAIYAGLTSNRWQKASMSNAGGVFTVAVSGQDTPLHYDGTSWAELSISGSSGPITLDASTLCDVMVCKRRLFFAQTDSLYIWFLDVTAIEGVAQLLDLGSVFDQGGSIACIGSWTRDGGAGPDDCAVFVTTKGQVAVYQGLDPSDATNWSLAGVYNLSEPVGRRSLVKFGSDLVLITSNGALPMSVALQQDETEDDALAITTNIEDAFAQAVESYGDNFGWQTIFYPAGGLAIVNVPIVELGTAYQYVQNTQTGAWCRFVGIDANCWEVANGKIYFGAVDGVYQWDTGSSDNGALITSDVACAPSDFGYAGSKKFNMMRPLLKCAPIVQPAMDLLCDYRESIPTAVPTVVNAGDLSPEDVNDIRYDWTSVTGIGFVGSARMRVILQGDTSNSHISIGDGTGARLAIDDSDDLLIDRDPLPFDVPVDLLGFDVMFQPGGAL